MPEPETQERSFRVRKDAKIALVVILALMVLVVVIWSRSPRPDEHLGVSTSTGEATPVKDDAAARQADVLPQPSPRADDAAPKDAVAAQPADPSPILPTDPAMMNQLRTSDQSIIQPTARPAAGADASTTTPSPAGTTRPPDTPTATPQPEQRAGITHVVVKGDTFMKLAKKYYGDANQWRLIANANGGQAATLRIGQKLTIPPMPATAKAAPAPKASADKAATASATPKAPATSSAAKTYTVKKGDTFTSIARDVCRDAGKATALYKHNKAKLPDPANPSSLRPGMVIEVPAFASSR